MNLLETEQTNSSKMETTPSTLSTNSSECQNSSCSLVESNETEIFSTQDRELAPILEDLENIDNNIEANATEKSRLSGYFCSDTIFNLSRKILTDREIKVLEKGLDYAPLQSKINEPELRNDFEGFCRRMRLKWYFRKEPTSEFSQTPSFTPKSSWKAPKGHPSLKLLLSEIEKEIFAIPDSRLSYSNLSREEWQAMRCLADDRSIVIKKADKGSSVAVWDRYDYIAEAEKQLKDQNVYKDVDFTEKILQDLAESSNKMLRSLKTKGKIDEKQLKYFTYEYKKTCNLGKLYLLPKIHKGYMTCQEGP